MDDVGGDVNLGVGPIDDLAIHPHLEGVAEGGRCHVGLLAAVTVPRKPSYQYDSLRFTTKGAARAARGQRLAAVPTETSARKFARAHAARGRPSHRRRPWARLDSRGCRL